MAQGARKVAKPTHGKAKAAAAAAGHKAQQPKKGRRIVAPKKRGAVKQAMLRGALQKTTVKNIESVMLSRAAGAAGHLSLLKDDGKPRKQAKKSAAASTVAALTSRLRK